jgi:hypothetical protein
MSTAGLVDSVVANSTSATNAKNGYVLTEDVDAAASGNPSIFTFQSAPVTHTSTSSFSGTGSRIFLITETGVVYATSTTTAPTANSTTRVVSGGSPLNN